MYTYVHITIHFFWTETAHSWQLAVATSPPFLLQPIPPLYSGRTPTEEEVIVKLLIVIVVAVCAELAAMLYGIPNTVLTLRKTPG